MQGRIPALNGKATRLWPCGTSMYYAGWHFRRRGEEYSLYQLPVNLSLLSFSNCFSVSNINVRFYLSFPASCLLPATLLKSKEVPPFAPGLFTESVTCRSGFIQSCLFQLVAQNALFHWYWIASSIRKRRELGLMWGITIDIEDEDPEKCSS